MPTPNNPEMSASPAVADNPEITADLSSDGGSDARSDARASSRGGARGSRSRGTSRGTSAKRASGTRASGTRTAGVNVRARKGAGSASIEARAGTTSRSGATSRTSTASLSESRAERLREAGRDIMDVQVQNLVASAERAGDYLRTHTPDEIRDELETRIRERPLYTVGIAFIAGYLIGKMVG